MTADSLSISVDGAWQQVYVHVMNDFKPVASIEERAPQGDIPGGIVVEVTWVGGHLDRPCTGGWYAGTMKLAKRLKAAIDAGAVFQDIKVATDINGKTYIQAHAKVLGRYLNADLKRLGF